MSANHETERHPDLRPRRPLLDEPSLRRRAHRLRCELLREFPPHELAAVYHRVRSGIGTVRSDSFNAELHALTICATVLRGRREPAGYDEIRRRLLRSDVMLLAVEGGSLRIIAISPSAAAMLGYAPAELVGRPGSVFRVGDPKTKVAQLRERGELVSQSTYRRRDGSTVDVRWHARRMTVGGREVFLNRWLAAEEAPPKRTLTALIAVAGFDRFAAAVAAASGCVGSALSPDLKCPLMKLCTYIVDASLHIPELTP